MAEQGKKYSNALFVSDLDGTLLNHHSKVSAQSVALLNAAIAKGAKFTIATSRTPATTTALLAEVNATLPYIVLAGAAIWDPRSEQYCDTRPISESDTQKLALIAQDNGLNPFVYRIAGSRIIACHSPELNETERGFVEERNGKPHKEFRFGHNVSEGEGEAVLMMCMDDYGPLCAAHRDIQAQMPHHVAMCYRDLFDPGKGLLEVYAPGVTKAATLKRLAGRLGVEETVAFGDNVNDIPMLKAATRAIAVANAVEEVKLAAHEVTGDNRSDSVARWISENI